MDLPGQAKTPRMPKSSKNALTTRGAQPIITRTRYQLVGNYLLAQRPRQSPRAFAFPGGTFIGAQCPPKLHSTPHEPIIRISVHQKPPPMYELPDKPPYETVKQRGRGKPLTHPVDRLRTRLWFHVVAMRSGLPTPYAIEKALAGGQLQRDASGVFRPRKWGQYQKGLKVPDDRPSPINAIEQAERYFPGTARWFRSPIWPVLRGEKCDRFFVEEGLRQLSPEVQKVFFEEGAFEQRSPYPQKPFGQESKAELLAIGSFDALVATVLLVALSEDIASPTLRELALNLYISLQPSLKETPELKPFYPELFSEIDARCKHWVYLSPNERLDMVIFWQGVAEDKTDEPIGTQATKTE